MKIRSAWSLLALAAFACSPPLVGALDFWFESDVLTVAFTPDEGLSYRPGTVFAELTAHDAKMGDSDTHRCVQVPPDGTFQVSLSEYAADAKIDIAIWHDDPRRAENRQPGAPLPEPRECAGALVTSSVWVHSGNTSKLPGSTDPEDPEVTPDPETPAGALAPLVVPKLCGDDRIEVELENVGAGPLKIMSAFLTDSVGSVVLPSGQASMPMTIPAKDSARIAIEFTQSFTNVALIVTTDEPNSLPRTATIRGTTPQLEVEKHGLSFSTDRLVEQFRILDDECAAVGDVELELLPFGGSAEAWESFTIVGCEDLGVACIREAGRDVAVLFDRVGEGAYDLATLRLTRVDDRSQTVDITLTGTRRPCTAPTIAGLTRTSTLTACVGETQTIQAETTGAIEHYSWWMYGQHGAITAGVEATASFVPSKAGPFGVGLLVINDCGGMAWTAEPLEIVVDGSCR